MLTAIVAEITKNRNYRNIVENSTEIRYKRAVLELDDYRWLFRHTPAMLAAIGEDGRFDDLSEQLLRRLDFARSELVGERPGRIVTAASAERIENELMPKLRRDGRLAGVALTLKARDGQRIQCLADAIVESSADGSRIRTAVRYSEIVTDDDAVLTEDALKILQKKNMLRALEKTNGRVSGDRGAAKLLGLKPTTLIDRLKASGLRPQRAKD